MPRKLSRKLAHRNHMIRNLATSLILYEKIITTSAKAKEIKPIVERVINIGKSNDLQAYRRLNGYLTHRNAVKKVIEILSPRYSKIPSGCIQIIHYQPRHGDNAPRDIIQFIKISPTKEESSKEKHENHK